MPIRLTWICALSCTRIFCAAGYNALTTTAVEDAPILLKATKARLVIVSSRIQMLRGKPIRAVLQEIVPDVRLLPLDDQFAALDPGEAAEKLLGRCELCVLPGDLDGLIRAFGRDNSDANSPTASANSAHF